MVHTSKRRSRESVTHSLDKDMSFHHLQKFLQTSKKLVTPLPMQEMFIPKPRDHWDNNLAFLIESQERLVKAMLRRHLQQFIFTRCFWPRKKLFTWIWTWWNGRISASLAISGLQSNTRTRSGQAYKLSKLLKWMVMITILLPSQHSSRLMKLLLSSRLSLILMEFQLTLKLIQLSFLWLHSHGSLVWCLVTWAMVQFSLHSL